jgi:hypothetical protein
MSLVSTVSAFATTRRSEAHPNATPARFRFRRDCATFPIRSDPWNRDAVLRLWRAYSLDSLDDLAPRGVSICTLPRSSRLAAAAAVDGSMTKSSPHGSVVGFDNVALGLPPQPSPPVQRTLLLSLLCADDDVACCTCPTRPYASETSVPSRSSAASGSAIDRTSMLWLSVISAHQPRCISFSATRPILCSEHSRCPNACNRCDLSLDLPFAQEQPCYPHLRVVLPRWPCWRHRNRHVSGSANQDLLTADRPCASSAHTCRDRRRRCFS